MKRDPRSAMSRDQAEMLAVAALSFIATRPDDLMRFMALSGASLASLRESAADPAFLLGVLDHLLADEALLVAFAADSGIAPERVAIAQHQLYRGGRNGDDPALP